MLRNIKKQSGFTLVEIMIAVCIVILISGLSIHSLLRAKINANEAAAMKELQIYSLAFLRYKTENAKYPNALSKIVGLEPYIDSALANGSKNGYNFSLVYGSDYMFRLVATPITPGVTGNKIFYIDQDGGMTELGSALTTTGTLNTNETKAIINLLTLQAGVEVFILTNGIYPTNLADLAQFIQDSELIQGLKDNYSYGITDSSPGTFQLAAVTEPTIGSNFKIDESGAISELESGWTPSPSPTPDPDPSQTPDPDPSPSPSPDPGPSDGGGGGGGEVGGGGGGCFLANTPILMADGSLKAIEEVKVGDIIMAFDAETGKLVPDQVSELFVHDADNYLIINGHLKVTGNHPVYSESKWVQIGTLNIGDTILNFEGKPLAITSKEEVSEEVLVYNFEVNPHHAYIADGFVVHNLKEVGF